MVTRICRIVVSAQSFGRSEAEVVALHFMIQAVCHSEMPGLINTCFMAPLQDLPYM